MSCGLPAGQPTCQRQLASHSQPATASQPASQPASQRPLQKRYDFFHKVITNPSLFGKIRPPRTIPSEPASQPASQPARQHEASTFAWLQDASKTSMGARGRARRARPRALRQHFGPLMDQRGRCSSKTGSKPASQPPNRLVTIVTFLWQQTYYCN